MCLASRLHVHAAARSSTRVPVHSVSDCVYFCELFILSASCLHAHPQQDQHGLGFDPFAGAEEFRAHARSSKASKQEALRQAAAAATSKLGMGGGRGAGAKRPRGVAFGGVADDSGMYGWVRCLFCVGSKASRWFGAGVAAALGRWLLLKPWVRDRGCPAAFWAGHLDVLGPVLRCVLLAHLVWQPLTTPSIPAF